MTTIEFNDTVLATRVETPRTSRLSRWFANWRRRRREKLTLAALSQMDARLLRDIGIEPGDVEDALLGLRSSALFDPLRR